MSQSSPIMNTAQCNQGHVSLFQAYCDLTKIKLSLLVVLSTAVAFVMASELGIDWLKFFWTVGGTTCCAAAAATLNQLFERRRDGSMDRTKSRPIPSGRISAIHAFIVGVLLTYIGVSMLALGANMAAAGIALTTILLYILVYTPLKPRTTFNTFVGAVVGALPPLIGWVAVAGTLGRGAWLLAGILFMWQIPHFMALAWKYRDDYEQAGFNMLPRVDPSGELTGRVSVVTALCLVPLCLLLTVVETTGIFFAISGPLLSLWMTRASIRFWRAPSNATAMKMFLASIIYLPLLFVLMLISRQHIVWEDVPMVVS